MDKINFCVGIDVSKDSLECSYARYSGTNEQVFSKVRKFKNDLPGFKKLLEWAGKRNDLEYILFVMEATGVYYENLAYWLHGNGMHLSVILPNRVNYFAKSHNIKTKTDSVDAKLLSMMGLERKLEPWGVPSDRMREIKALTREYCDLKSKLTTVRNQLHAKCSAYRCPLSVRKRLGYQKKMLEKQISQVEMELRIIVKGDDVLSKRVERLESIPGIGFMTIVCVLGETNAFALMHNSKQLVSYCGLDVRHRQSGLKAGKTAISKKGNSFVRSALYMPALSALQCNPGLKVFYDRLAESKIVKKIAVTAVARKLLVLIYTLWKNESVFEPNYGASA